MAFIPYFKRPDPRYKYLDKVIASTTVVGIYIGITGRGICIERDTDEVDDNDEVEDNEE